LLDFHIVQKTAGIPTVIILSFFPFITKPIYPNREQLLDWIRSMS
jgi:hypothetical protein